MRRIAILFILLTGCGSSVASVDQPAALPAADQRCDSLIEIQEATADLDLDNVESVLRLERALLNTVEFVEHDENKGALRAIASQMRHYGIDRSQEEWVGEYTFSDLLTVSAVLERLAEDECGYGSGSDEQLVEMWVAVEAIPRGTSLGEAIRSGAVEKRQIPSDFAAGGDTVDSLKDCLQNTFDSDIVIDQRVALSC